MTDPLVARISARLSLRAPQHDSLEILARVADLVSLDKESDPAAALAAIQAEFTSVEDFERDFASVCFALATGVGKTRLMGAFIAYLYAAKNIKHFFVLAPSLTIYDKLIRDFTPGTPKYVFQGIADFAAEPPEIITGDNYESGRGVRSRDLFGATNAHINVFNISKINTEVRGGRAPRIKRLSEYIGESYFDYLASLDDLVLLMDESHRYRGAAGFRAISELKPVLGLELTATPRVEAASGPIPFRNIIYSYPLANAMKDGFVKEPAVATRENFNPDDYDKPQLEELKLRDGIVLHENVKAEWQAYARNSGSPLVKPFMLVVAENTDHANALVEVIRSDRFFDGYYRDRVITVHSRQSGLEEDANVARLLAVESVDEPTEIVVHVNKLKEGWDVTNLYTIVPLRAARVKTLVEQTIGRGLRLPYGRRTGVEVLDTLTIVAHDEFDEIVREANLPGSIIRRGIRIGRDVSDQRKTVVTVTPFVEQSITNAASNLVFPTAEEREVALAALEVIERAPWIPEIGGLSSERNRLHIVQRIADRAPGQTPLDIFRSAPRVESIVERTTRLVESMTIAIPRIVVVPRGEVRVGYHDFDLDVLGIPRLQAVPENVLVQFLRTNERKSIFADQHLFAEAKPEDYLVRALIDFDDIDYDRDAELLYKLSAQTVTHLRSYLHTDDALHNVLQYHQRHLADVIHGQLERHWWEDAPAGYEARAGRGFHLLKSSIYTVAEGESVRDFREAVEERQLIRGMLFSGFQRCLYPQQKFDSDSERRFAVICDSDPSVEKWFKPASNSFRIDYKHGVSYEPDFVIETRDAKLLCEPKRASEMASETVRLKRDAATEWCRYASEYESENGGKPWRYALIPHDAITSTSTFPELVARFVSASN
jgi:type III restriction enzyme